MHFIFTQKNDNWQSIFHLETGIRYEAGYQLLHKDVLRPVVRIIGANGFWGEEAYWPITYSGQEAVDFWLSMSQTIFANQYDFQDIRKRMVNLFRPEGEDDE